VLFAPGIVFAQQAKKPSSTHEQYIELGDALVGKWTGESIVTFDLEGICKKGDVLTIKDTTEWVLDKVALIRKGVYEVKGKKVAEGVALITWNAARSQIKAIYTDSLGSNVQSTLRKARGKWVSQDRGVCGDGRKVSAKVEMSFSPDGQSCTVTTTESTFGDEQLPDDVTAYRRVK
jgi:hypothetical protein